MLRIRFGKLAIAVLAVSGAAAHAEFGETSFLDKFKGWKVGFEGMAPFVHGEKTWASAFKTPVTESKVGGGYVEMPAFFNLGPVKVSARVGGESLYVNGLHRTVTETAEEIAAKAEKVASPDESSSKDNTAKVVRTANEVNGGIANAAFQLTYDLKESLYVRGTLGGGVVRPASTDRYVAGIASVGLGYKVNSLISVEGAVKHIHPLDKYVNPVTGLALGIKFTY